MAGVSGMSMRLAPAAVAEVHWPKRMASRAPWVATREDEQAARVRRVCLYVHTGAVGGVLVLVMEWIPCCVPGSLYRHNPCDEIMCFRAALGNNVLYVF